MDERYYMLGGLGLLLVGLMIYFLVALGRYRSAVRRAKAVRSSDDEGEAKYLGPSAEAAEDVFSIPAAGEITATPMPVPPAIPPSFDFTLPQVQVAETTAPAELRLPEVHSDGHPAATVAHTAAEFGEPDLGADLPDEPEPPVARQVVSDTLTPRTVMAPEPMVAPTPEPEPEPEPEPVLSSLVEAAPPAAPEPPVVAPPAAPEAPAPVDVVAPAQPLTASASVVPTPPQADLAAEFSTALAEAFGDAPAAPIVPEPVAAPTPSPTAPPAPAPSAAPASQSPPPAGALPGYSLADELERLMTAAEAAPLLTPEEHAAAIAPAALAREAEELFEVAAEPLFPAPSVGQALSTASPAAASATPEPVAAPRPAATPAPSMASQAPAAPPKDVPDYRLVAPVELHFTAGQSRIGVKPGTRSYAEFQRLAGILLDDLREARGW